MRLPDQLGSRRGQFVVRSQRFCGGEVDVRLEAATSPEDDYEQRERQKGDRDKLPCRHWRGGIGRAAWSDAPASRTSCVDDEMDLRGEGIGARGADRNPKKLHLTGREFDGRRFPPPDPPAPPEERSVIKYDFDCPRGVCAVLEIELNRDDGVGGVAQRRQNNKLNSARFVHRGTAEALCENIWDRRFGKLAAGDEACSSDENRRGCERQSQKARSERAC